MRPETELIKKIQELRGIKPRQDWVVSVKNQILEREIAPVREGFLAGWRWPRLVLQYRMAVVSLVVAGLLIGTFSFAQKAMPGDFLYALKKVAEKTKLSFAPEQEKPMIHLEHANEKLQNIVKIVEGNRKEKITPIIEEYQNNVSEAAKSLSQTQKPDVKKIVEKTKEINENKQKIEALGLIIGESEELEIVLTPIYKEEAERLIEDLKESTLLENQQECLDEAVIEYEEENFNQALELLLNCSQEK